MSCKSSPKSALYVCFWLGRPPAIKTFFLNGTFYISKVSKFLKNKNLFNNSLGYLTKKQYSFEIDDELDFKILKYLIIQKTLSYIVLLIIT